MKVDKGPKDKVCPFHKEPMSKVCHKCPFWTKYEGMVDKKVHVSFDCGLAALSPQLLGLRAGLGAVQEVQESFRNEMVNISNAPLKIEYDK